MLPFYQKNEADDLQEDWAACVETGKCCKEPETQAHSDPRPLPQHCPGTSEDNQRLYYCALTVLTFGEQQELYQARKTEGKKDGRW